MVIDEAPSEREPQDGPTSGTAPGPVRVAVDNDFPVVVAGLTAMLADHADRVELVTLGQQGEAIDVILYDTFGAPGSLEEYVAQAPAKVMVFTHVTDPATVINAVKAGIAGYVYKGVSVDHLVEALLSARDASMPVIALNETAATFPGVRNWPGKDAALTEREAEIIALVCSGLSNKEIAGHLHLSVNSVKTYVRHAYRKIGVDSRSKAVLWGLGNGFGTAS